MKDKKICPKCDTEKLIEEFHVNKTKKGLYKDHQL